MASSKTSPRILPDGVSVEITHGTWPELPTFGLMQRLGNVDKKEMFRTFNMGIGMIVVCSEDVKYTLENRLERCYEIGRITSGNQTEKIIS